MADQPASAPASAPAPASVPAPAPVPASEPALTTASSEPVLASASEPGLEAAAAAPESTGSQPQPQPQPTLDPPAVSALHSHPHPHPQPMQDQHPLPSIDQNGMPPMHHNGMGFQLDGQPMLLAYQDPNYAASMNMMPLGGGHQMNLTIGNGAHLGQGTNSGHQNVKDITADEIALYDRQIRLWGIQAQKRIQGAKVLLITMKALANEIAKNLVLAGIGSLTVVDDHIVQEADLGAQFFLSKEHIGQNRAEAASTNIRKLNPRVEVTADAESIMTKGASYFAGFDIIIATDLFPTTLAFINTATRLHGRQFYAAGTHGLYGYIFCDLIEHDYVLQREKSNVPAKLGEETRTRSVIDVKEKKEGGKTIEMITKRELYSTWDLASETSLLPADYRNSKRRLKAVTPALSCLRALWSFQSAQNRDPGRTQQDLQFFARSATFCHQGLMLPAETLRSDFLRSFLSNIGSEIAPVTAILGGQLAQDVINVLGQSQPPIQNMVIFDGNTMQAEMYPLHPEVTLGKAQLDMGMPPMPPMGDMPHSTAPGIYDGQFPDMTNPAPPM